LFAYYLILCFGAGHFQAVVARSPFVEGVTPGRWSQGRLRPRCAMSLRSNLDTIVPTSSGFVRGSGEN
jgi:hypothetical protein